MITEFTTKVITSIDGFYEGITGTLGAAFLTPATTVMLVGVVLYLMIGSVRGLNWMNDIAENSTKCTIQVGLPTVVVSFMFLRAAGVL